MSKNSTKPTSRSFNRLLRATTAEEILNALTTCCWETLGDSGEPPSLPTPDDLQDFKVKPHYFDEAFLRSVVTAHGDYFFLMDKNTDVVERFETELSRLEIDAFDLAKSFLHLSPHRTQLISLLPDFDFSRRLLTDYFFSQAGHPSQGWIEKSQQGWIIARKENKKLPHPLALIVRQWLIEQTHRTIKSATVDHVQELTTSPYVVSEVNRRKWERVGSVDVIEVDGEPIITHMRKLPGPFVKDPDEVRAFKPKGTKGELMPMPKQRDNMETPIPLIAYQKYGSNLRSAIASDVAQLMSIAYTSNEPLILSVKDGAHLLARDHDGKPRRITNADEQRFETAFACVHGMAAWIVDERHIARFYPLTACDRFSDNRVSIAAASWARERKAGRWTLTAGVGVAGQNRLKGNAHNNNVWRVITGVEYWIARQRFTSKGTHKGISQALIPASGTTGPSIWYTLSWQEFMMIAGDIWDQSDKDANWKAYQRFNKIRNSLIQHDYQIQNLNKPAEAGDTVEFLFQGKNGKVKVRATARFIEGARKAKRQDWQTVNLSDFLGF